MPIELPFSVPSHRSNRPYEGEGVTLPNKRPEAEVIDSVLTDPVLVGELRSRGALPARTPMKGYSTTAPRDTICTKALGWLLTDNGRLETVECGAAISKGDRCWVQGGFQVYGMGCHTKIYRLSKKFVDDILSNPIMCEGMHERQLALTLAQAIWKDEQEAGNIGGEFGSVEAEQSRIRGEKLVKEILVMRKANGWKDESVPKRLRRPVKEKPQPEQAASPLVQLPAANPTGEVQRFTLKQKREACIYVNLANVIAEKTRLTPLRLEKKGRSYIAFLNPGGSYTPITL